MSSTITIPIATSSTSASSSTRRDRASSKATESSSSSYSSSPRMPESASSSPGSSAAERPQVFHARRPSLLSSAISKEESQTINIGDPDGPPRLISYLASSQGFTWNPEMFLPSYIDYDYTPLENRREPVHEIILTDEEIANMLPQ